jgi:hypothetical protein
MQYGHVGESALYAECGACGARFDIGAWRDRGGDVAELEAFAAAHAQCDRAELTLIRNHPEEAAS